MRPHAFATREPLAAGQLSAAPIRYPRSSRLNAPLQLQGAKAQRAAATLGLITVGDLLEHLPHDRREARAVVALEAGETATVVVEVVSIASRPVRRRGMRPLVQATVADGTGRLAVTFFNQPWLVERYPPGTRLVLHGKAERAGRFTVQAHARTNEATTPAGGATAGAGAGAATPSAGVVAHYPATDGLSSTQILAMVSGTSAPSMTSLNHCRWRCAPVSDSPSAVQRSEPRISRGPRTIRSWRGAGSRSRSCCSTSSR